MPMEMERKLVSAKFLEAVEELRVRDGKDYKLVGDSPFGDLELDFKFDPAVAALPEYEAFIDLTNEWMISRLPHMDKLLSRDNPLGLTEEQLTELRELGARAKRVADGTEPSDKDMAPSLWSLRSASLPDDCNPFYEQLRYDYLLVISGGHVVIPKGIKSTAQVLISDGWGVMTPSVPRKFKTGEVINLHNFSWETVGDGYYTYDFNINPETGAHAFVIMGRNDVPNLTFDF